MFLECFEVLRMVTSIIYVSLPSIFAAGRHVYAKQDYQGTRRNKTLIFAIRKTET